MKVLFIGGTGVISSACAQLAMERGMDLTFYNRGETARPVPPGVNLIRGNIRDLDATRRALDGHVFDVVIDWIAFTPDQVAADVELFRGYTGQYIFISSASAYQKPPVSLPITESTPLSNPFWAYSRNKIACEEYLMRAYRDEQFPVTIVRPSHTYDRTKLPFFGGFTIVDRMRRGQKVIVHGDGTSLWVLTHHMDFALGFTGLLGNIHAIGDAIHITADEWLTWNQIFEIVGHAAGVEPQLVHMASEQIATFQHDWGTNLIGDKMHSMVFDNTKIKRLVPGFVATRPFTQGAREIIAWYDADPARRVISPELNELLDRMIGVSERSNL